MTDEKEEAIDLANLTIKTIQEIKQHTTLIQEINPKNIQLLQNIKQAEEYAIKTKTAIQEII